MEFGQAALAGERVYWFAAANAPAGAPDGPGDRKRDVLDRFGAWHDPIPAIITATNEGAILFWGTRLADVTGTRDVYAAVATDSPA